MGGDCRRRAEVGRSRAGQPLDDTEVDARRRERDSGRGGHHGVASGEGRQRVQRLRLVPARAAPPRPVERAGEDPLRAYLKTDGDLTGRISGGSHGALSFVSTST